MGNRTKKIIFNLQSVCIAVLSLLLILIFLSRTIYNFNLPVITAVSPQEGKLNKIELTTGIVKYEDVGELYSAVSGTVGTILVHEGDIVSKGQPIMEMSFAGAADTQIKLSEFKISRDKLYVDIKKINIFLTAYRVSQLMMNGVASKDRDIAMVFQNYALYPHMTVYDNIAFGLKLRKMPKKEIKRKVHEAAVLLEIEHLLDKQPKVLSGGQRQRVAMGRAIVREPKVFLMDEPLSNLDAKLRVQMRAAISKLHQKLQTTFIYVTHDQTEAMTLGTRIVVMKDGNIHQIDTPHNLYNKPNNLFVAGFIGSPPMNFIKAVAKGQGEALELRTSDYNLRLNYSQSKILIKNGYKDNEVIMGIRPENLSVCENLNDCDANNTVEACIEITELLGAETLLHLNLGKDSAIVRTNPQASYKPGSKVKLLINPEKIHVFDKASEEAIL